MTTIENNFRALVNGNTGTVYNGTAGTNRDVRANVWDAFRAKYSTVLDITIEGIALTLTASHSLSGKSTSYHATLTPEQYIAITGSDFGLSKKSAPYISISIGICEVHGGGKHFVKVPNSDIYFIAE